MEDAVDCPQECAPGLVVKHNNHTGCHQWRAALELLLYTPGEEKKCGREGEEREREGEK